MTNYSLSPRAQADLDEIWRYSVQHWGMAQAEAYIRQIKTTVEYLVSEHSIGRRCDDIRLGYWKYSVGSHVLFYRLATNGINVTRIMHARMDFDRHL